jgi:hypothetical protein
MAEMNLSHSTDSGPAAIGLGFRMMLAIRAATPMATQIHNADWNPAFVASCMLNASMLSPAITDTINAMTMSRARSCGNADAVPVVSDVVMALIVHPAMASQ